MLPIPMFYTPSSGPSYTPLPISTNATYWFDPSLGDFGTDRQGNMVRTSSPDATFSYTPKNGLLVASITSASPLQMVMPITTHTRTTFIVYDTSPGYIYQWVANTLPVDYPSSTFNGSIFFVNDPSGTNPAVQTGAARIGDLNTRTGKVLPTIGATGWNILIVRSSISQTVNTMTITSNGVVKTTRDLASGDYGWMANYAYYYTGTLLNVGGTSLRGDMITFDSLLSDVDVLAVEDYLKSKWGIVY